MKILNNVVASHLELNSDLIEILKEIEMQIDEEKRLKIIYS